MTSTVKGAVTPRKVNAQNLPGLKLSSFAVAGLPSAAANAGRIVHCSNGATGQPCLAYSNGTSWLRVVFGAAVAAS